MSGRWCRVGTSLVAVVVALVLMAQPLQVAAVAAAPLQIAAAAAALPPVGSGISTGALGTGPLDVGPGAVPVAPLDLWRTLAEAPATPVPSAPESGQTVTIPVMPLQSGDGLMGPPTQPEPAGTGLIVRFKGGAATRMAVQSLSALGVEAVSPRTRDGLQLMRLAPGMALKDALAKLRLDPRVEYAEPNYQLQAQGTTGTELAAAAAGAQAVPNDPRYADQWGLTEVQAPWAWEPDEGVIPQAVTVAVVDTGVDANHEDLTGRVLPGHNSVTGAPDPGDAHDDTASGHGTHVAGIIAATADNGKGVAGVTGPLPVSVLPVKVLDATGTGTMYDVAQGIIWATDAGARVINLSLGARLPDFPLTLADAVQYAQDRGALVVAAAGNEGGSSTEGFYPASLPKVVSVAASGPDHHRAAFSNPGQVTAPGVDILSTLPGNRYGTMSGTSMAAPFAAGTAALLWSKEPSSTVSQVISALNYGRSDYSEGCTNYWWGRTCSNYIYVLNAYNALSNLHEPTGDYIEFTQPENGAHVFNTTELCAEVPNPANVAKVRFTLDPWNDPAPATPIAELDGPAAGATAGSGLFSALWDTTKVENGLHTLLAETFDNTGARLTSASVQVLVENEFRSGLRLQILKPDESPGAGARVRVYHAARAADGTIETIDAVWEGSADLQGRVVLSGFEATDGNSYLVTAQGTEPAFLYHELLSAPSQATLGPATSRKVTLKGLRLDGQPLATALVLADFQDVRAQDGGYVSPDLIGQIPIATLNGAGEAEVWLSPGPHNLRLVSPADAYYLQQQVVVAEQDLTVDFPHTPAELASIRLAPDGDLTANGIQLRDAQGDVFVGFDGLDGLAGGTTVTVTPGRYTALVEATAVDPTYSDGSGNLRTWIWELFVPYFELEPAENRVQAYGGAIGATLRQAPFGDTWQAGQYAWLAANFPDAHGNLTTLLGWQPTAPTGAGAAAAAATSNVVVRAPASPAPSPGPLTAPPAGEGMRPFRYVPASGRLEAMAVSLTEATRTLEIRDSSDALVTAGDRRLYWFGQVFGYDPDDITAYWQIPWLQPAGAYTARVKIDAGFMGPAASNGVAESADSAFTVLAAADSFGPNLSVHVLDRVGDPLSGATVMVLRQTSGAYYPDSEGEAELRTDSQGNATYTEPMDAESQYALAVYGDSRLPGDPTIVEPMFLFVPLAKGEPPLSVTVDPSSAGLGLTRVVLQGLDEGGQPLAEGTARPAVFGVDPQGAVGGMVLPGLSFSGGSLGARATGSFEVWLPKGRYVFQLDLNDSPYWSPEAVGDSYHLVREVRVPEDVAADGSVTLGGTSLTQITVQGPPPEEFGPPTFSLGGFALFSSGLPTAELFRGPVFVAPGSYQIETLLARAHFDGEWDYWLEDTIVAPDAGTVTHQVDSAFTATLTLDANAYGGGDTVRSTHRITDSHGNRLIAVVQDLGAAISSLAAGESGDLAVWRTPGSDLLFGVPPASAGAAGATGELPVETLNHQRIAPFLVIRDPSGQEIYRYKDAGPDFDNLGRLRPEVPAPVGGSTFFGGKYTLPEHADAGSYTALLELGAGPDGLVDSTETTFTVGGVGGAPRLGAPPPITNAASIDVTGTATPGAQVTLMQSLNSGAATLAGTATVGADGRFSVVVALTADGSYTFTATASLGGATSPESQPVTVVADRTPPGPAVNVKGEAEDQNHIRLTWEASASDDVAAYRILRNGEAVVEVPVGSALTCLDSGLQPLTEYEYSVLAVDRAGNASEPALLRVSTNTAPDVEPPSAPKNLQAAYRTGGMVDLTWEAATDNIQVEGYRIWRATGAGEKTQIAELSRDQALAFRDEGLAAETAYTYTVTARDGAGNESAGSDPAVLTTPTMTLTAPTWRASPGLSRNQLLPPGAEIAIRMLGERLRQGSVDLEYLSWLGTDGGRLAEPRPVQETLALTESSVTPGLYQGNFTLPEATAELTAIHGNLRDGFGHTTGPKDAANLPKDVTGSALIQLVVPADAAVGDLRLLLWSESKRSGGQLAANAAGAHRLTDLAPAADYDLKVFAPGGRQVAGSEQFTVERGAETSLEVQPRLQAALRVEVVDPAGRPIPDAWIVPYNETLKRLVDGASTTAAGPAPTFTGLWEGDDITTRVFLSGESAHLPLEGQASKATTLVPGVNAITVTVSALPVGTVSGHAADTQSQPLAGIVVTGSVRLGARFITATAVSGSDGAYSLALPAGAATVDAASANAKYRLGQPTQVQVLEGVDTPLNLTLDTLGPGQVTITLRTKYADGLWQERTELAWQDTAHFRLNVQGRGWGYPVSIYGRPGEVLTASVDGQEVGLPRQTKEVTLDDHRNGHVVFELEEQGRITGRLVDESGRPLTGQGWWATFRAADGTGDGTMSGAQTGWEDEVRIHLPKPGKYKVEFMTLEAWTQTIRNWNSYSYAYSSLPRALFGEVEIDDVGRIVNLGDIRLSRQRGGLAGSVTATPREATPGTTLSLRAEFGLAPNTVPLAAANAELVLDIPDGATLVPGSVTLDGTPVAVSEGSSVTVPLGDMTFGVGQRHVVRYQVRLGAVLDAPSLRAAANVRWGPEAGRVREDLVPATVPRGRITLNGPSGITRLNLTLWGRAPAGSTVMVYDNQVLLGQALASAAGFWYLAANLPDLGPKTSHALQATAVTETETMTSPSVVAIYDPAQPALVSFTMGQPGGRTVSVDPTVGIPAFPFVVVPSQPFQFSLDFSAPNRVDHVKVFLGKYEMTASRSRDGSYTASSPAVASNAQLGDVYVSYDVMPPVEELKRQPPTPEEQRLQLPEPLRDYVVLGTGTLAEDPAQPGQRGAWLEVAPRPDSNLTMRVEMTIRKGVQYTPTASQLAEAEESGIPVYGFSFASTMTAHTYTIETSGYLPESVLDTTQPEAPGEGGLAAAEGLLGAAGLNVVVRVGSKITFTSEQAFNAYDWGSSLKDGFDVPDKFKQLDDLLDQSTDCGGSASSYRAEVDQLADKAMAIEAAKWGMMLAGVLLGPETFGIGTLLLWGASEAMEWAMDRSLDKSMDALRQRMSNDAECKRDDDDEDDPDDPDDPNRPPDDPRHPRKRIARPTYTWDPSGYVYEAVESNRLEGVTATAFQWDDATSSWLPWDAAWFAQENPQTTDPQGAYGWDVPPGDWQVLWQKPGYEPAQSAALTVPPPRTEVNAGLVSLAAPQVATVTVATGGAFIEVIFDKFMRASTLAESTFLVSLSEADAAAASVTAAAEDAPAEETPLEITGTVQPVSPVTAADGSVLAKVFRFIPSTETPLVVGKTYDLTIAGIVQSYAGRPMAGDVNRSLTIAAEGGAEPPPPPPPPRPRPTQDLPANEFRATVGQGAQTIDAFDGEASLSFDGGTFPAGTTLVIRKLGVPQQPVEVGAGGGNASLTAGSVTYELDAGGANPAKPVTLTLRYDGTLLAGIDIRKFGIYRRDDNDATRWSYVGGFTDSTGRSVTVTLTHFSQYAVMANQLTFNDLASHWSRADIEVLASRHVVGGVSPQEFQPDRTITRAELAKLLVEMVRRSRSDVQVVGGNIPTFTDVAPEAWYYAYVETAARLGLMKGDAGRARPGASVTREEMAVMLIRAMSLESRAAQAAAQTLPYGDAAEVATWAKGYVAIARQLGLMQGVTPNAFQPQSSATRAQGAVVVLRAMEQQGLLLAPVTLTGTVRLSQLEGAHLELEVTVAGQATRYVLLPVGGAGGDLAARLNALDGKQAQIKGVLDDSVTAYMSGPALKVFEVTPLP